ncbi:TPA: NERD domain-containing protein [Pseudomonas aeruginosa]|uniref:NERD domain-containing protein n=1 Tax=Pseudomonas TaxID=286 RepID=UPI001CD2AB1E|nr:NERD domain-containing protein [Pseudomonas aeruginosa]MCZ9819127.1 NERD domain-containing protein [Pseudomonas aeruginosa]MCZ9833256.1 NERD domain-containing protein [Pseudomonas aeruginosa]MCZ9863525.1 NERD domain-containing protein [Pseudomonas aeruginosa]MCZ9903029.1 NERD domain-containing protein [Pseudomonas aeruginosa]MDE9391521.1 NERD domain-containing protein [Pseudomonas aeruginosa]
MSEKGNRCLQHYLLTYRRTLSTGSSRALDECLHHFLDQRPAGKHLSALDRAIGLASAPFWWDPQAVQGSELASLALSRVLHFDNAISLDLLVHLANRNPETLRWAIRYSKLFERSGSPLWTGLRAALEEEGWQIFFGVCERLLEQLESFDELIFKAENQLKHLSLLELLSYLSVLAYQAFTDEVQADPSGQQWEVYNRIILRKLQTCQEEDFRLNELRLGRSLKQHLAPILFMEPGTADSAECRANLESLAVLIAATHERIDYEGSINWFCFDSECRYQLKPGEPVLYNDTEEGAERWRRTGHKHDLLWHYWMNRAVQELIDSGMAGEMIGSAENHELNQLAYIKTLRSKLQLQTIYGVEEHLSLGDGSKVQLQHVLLASELTSVFFQKEFIQPFQEYFRDSGVVAHALGRLAMKGMQVGENRFPMTWSEEEEKIRRISGWTVCEEHPKGSADSAKSILKFWTSDLKSLSQQLKAQPRMPVPRLYERPFYKIGRYSFQFPWIVAQQNNLTATFNNLRRLGARRAGMQAETRQVELLLAESLRRRGFAVEVGFRPPVTEDDDAGEVDLICQLDGVLLLLEVKSGYIRSTTHEVWLHRSNTLRKAAWQLRRKLVAVAGALREDQSLRSRLGYRGEHLERDLRAWIVDTSIELDGQLIDGYRVVSREALEVILRDEKHLLQPVGQVGADDQDSLFPEGFSAGRFVEIVESGALWRDLC